jgi:hypothetical protein
MEVPKPRRFRRNAQRDQATRTVRQLAAEETEVDDLVGQGGSANLIESDDAVATRGRSVAEDALG